MHSVVMVALLPVPSKNCNITQTSLDQERQTHREVVNRVLWWLLKPLTCNQNPITWSAYYNVLCADGNFRHCKSDLAPWLAECPEYSDLRQLEWHVCFWCETPKNELGDYVHPDKQHPRRDHNVYRTLSDANPKAADAELSSRHIYRGFNVFCHIPCIVSNLPQPDLLHTMQIGMLDHLQKWIFHFMNMHQWLDKYKAIWLSVPSYHDLIPKYMSQEAVCQWNGKEMKGMSRYLLGVVTQSRRGGNPTQRPMFNSPTECSRALLEFNMYARYKAHDDATSSYMEDTLYHLDTFNDEFLLGRASKKAKAKANVMRTELVKK